MKLYATIKNAEGKEVKIGSNEQIECTLYDRNKKSYSVYIGWADIGDIEKPTMGAIVTTREWRNKPDNMRLMPSTKEIEAKADRECQVIQNYGEQHPLFHSKKMKEWRKGKKQKGEIDKIEFEKLKTKASFDAFKAGMGQ